MAADTGGRHACLARANSSAPTNAPTAPAASTTE